VPNGTGTGERPEVSVVIGTFNRLRYLRATLESVRDELARVPHEILVVDGGSTDGTIRWLTGQKDVISIVQHNRGTWRGREIERRSWGYFMNLGFKAAAGRLVCMLSDDCLVVPGAITNGLRVFDERTAAGEGVGAVAFYWRDFPVQPRYRVGVAFGDRLFVNHGLYLRAALQDVGYVDEEDFAFYHADGDLALRLAEAGYACVDSKDSYVEHYADANPAVRASNLVTQRADWETYSARWSRLGEPTRQWLEREHHDAHGTARRYWGPLLTNLTYRRLQRARELLTDRIKSHVNR
jgi:GT2 family glycosyltransferase